MNYYALFSMLVGWLAFTLVLSTVWLIVAVIVGWWDWLTERRELRSTTNGDPT